jgi:hypothetical protein
VLDYLTTALESAAVVLLVVAAGWVTLLVVGAPFGWPAALAVSGVVAAAASQALQWADAHAGGER